MAPRTTHVVNIIRETAIQVTVSHYPGSPQTLMDPGDPEETSIESAFDYDGNAIELTAAEEEEAIGFINLSGIDPNPIDPDPDTDDGIDELSVMTRSNS